MVVVSYTLNDLLQEENIMKIKIAMLAVVVSQGLFAANPAPLVCDERK